jgi:V8-like Glu-specific endopeptidase
MKTAPYSPFLDALCSVSQREEPSEIRFAPMQSPYLQGFEGRDVAADETHAWLDEADEALTEEEKGVIGRGDDRQPVADTSAVPFRWICSIAVQRRIEHAGGRTSLTGLAPAGTGLLISPRHVLTAAHVLRGANSDDDGNPLPGIHEAQAVAVKPGRNGAAEPFGEIEAESWVAHPSWRANKELAQYDLALITLKQAVGEQAFRSAGGQSLSWWGGPGAGADHSLDNLPAAIAAALIGRRVITAGYPGKSKGVMVCAAGVLSTGSSGQDAALSRSGRIAQWAERAPIYSITADATKGQSGSPVWVLDRGRRYLVGILGRAGDAYNQALALNAAVLQQIARWMGSGSAGELQYEALQYEALPWQDEEPVALDEETAEPFEVKGEPSFGSAPELEFDAEPQEDFDVPAEVEQDEDEALYESENFEALPEWQHDSPPSVREVVVGQRIVLDLDNTPFAGKIDRLQWSVPGRFVRGYDGTVNDARLFELSATDLQQPRISFFWVDAGDGRTVRARIRTKTGSDEIFSAAFDVKGPTVEAFDAKVDVTRKERRSGLLGMRLGKLVEAPGIKWNWKVTLPARHAGRVKDVQTVLQDRLQVLRVAPGSAKTRKLIYRHPSKPTIHSQLDGHADGEAIYTTGLAEPQIAAGDSFANTGTSDSPHTNLPSLGQTVAVNDQFTYFILFKPTTEKPQDAIWVPVAKARWAWQATARHDSGGWKVSAPKMKPSFDKATPDFPLYDSNAAENEWLEDPPPQKSP